MDSHPANIQKQNGKIMEHIPSLLNGIPTPQKNVSSSVGMIIPNIWKIKAMFPTTNQIKVDHVQDKASYLSYNKLVYWNHICSKLDDTLGPVNTAALHPRYRLIRGFHTPVYLFPKPKVHISWRPSTKQSKANPFPCQQ